MALTWVDINIDNIARLANQLSSTLKEIIDFYSKETSFLEFVLLTQLWFVKNSTQVSQ